MVPRCCLELEESEKSEPGKVCLSSRRACEIKKLRRESRGEVTGSYWCNGCNRTLVSKGRRIWPE